VLQTLSGLSNIDLLKNINVDCNKTESVNQELRKRKLDFLKKIDFNEFIRISFMESKENVAENFPVLSYSLNVDINVYSNKHEDVTDLANWRDGELKKINATITPAKRFFRIGVVEVNIILLKINHFFNQLFHRQCHGVTFVEIVGLMKYF